MTTRTLNFKAGNGNWWRPYNHKRKLLNGPEHTFHGIHGHIFCSFVGKHGWKTVESFPIWFVFLIAFSGGNFWCPLMFKTSFFGVNLSQEQQILIVPVYFYECLCFWLGHLQEKRKKWIAGTIFHCATSDRLVSDTLYLQYKMKILKNICVTRPTSEA